MLFDSTSLYRSQLSVNMRLVAQTTCGQQTTHSGNDPTRRARDGK
jgi:hypothetical protein